MVYDCFTYAGEADMLEIRLELLSPHVDKFVIAESDRTFSGNGKSLTFLEDYERFKKWHGKILYVPVGDMEDEDIVAQMDERDYVDQPHFRRAFYQKEMLRKALEALKPDGDDIVYYGDVDELWKPKDPGELPWKLRQICYSYYLNNRSPEDWRGTVVTKWKNVKCLNDMRANPERIMEDGGWHFTNLGGLEAVRNKIASYDHQEVNVPFVTESLHEKLENNEDFLGRGWKFWEDASELPIWIIENRGRFKEKGLWK